MSYSTSKQWQSKVVGPFLERVTAVFKTIPHADHHHVLGSHTDEDRQQKKTMFNENETRRKAKGRTNCLPSKSTDLVTTGHRSH